MSEPIDEIRAKRLAKLGAAAQSQSQSQSPRSQPQETPSPQHPVQTISSTPPIVAAAQRQEQTPSTRQTPPQETIASWADKELSHILGATLDMDTANGDDVVFLENTFTDLVEEGIDPVFSAQTVDRAIIERLSELGVPNPFKYLKDAWYATQQSKRLLKAKDPLREEKLAILDEVDRLTSSYGLVSFQIADIFLNGNIKNFLKDIIGNQSNYSDFLIQIIGHAQEEGTLIDFLNIFVPNLSKLILKTDLNSPNYPLILNIFQLLISEKSVAAIFTEIEGFKITDPTIEPSKFELTTILGPIFKLSPLQETVAASLFDRTVAQSQLKIQQAGQALQAEHKVLLDRLFFIVDKIIRGSTQSRTDILEYFATIINKNHLRRGDHADMKKLSSNAFVTNISLVLVKLSLPFTDASLSKIDRIDINYFQRSSQLLDIFEETRTNASATEATEYYENNKKDDKPNFISDCFFLTMAYLHYGIGGTLLSETKLKRHIKQLQSNIDQVKASKNHPNPMMRMAHLQLPRMEKQLADFKAQKDAITSFFTDKDLQLEIFDFVSGACAFLIRTIDPNHSYPQGKLSLPLVPDVIGVENVDNTEYFRTKAPTPFKYYPEFTVEGILNYAKYICRFNKNPMVNNNRLSTFVEFAVTFLRCPELVGNPHLKGRLVEALSSGTFELYVGRPGFMMEIFDTNPLVSANLLYALLDFYVVVEKTGSSSQFYDKFNSRYHISAILEQIWKNPLYKKQLIYQSEKNEEFFIRFVARMLNDLTFLLDESLRHLSEVHSVQQELTNRQNGISNLEGTDEELQNRLSSSENQASSNVGLANKSIDLFGMFTKDVPRAFIKPEIVGRLASMLDYNLAALVGPKCTELKVRDPEKYKFNPKELLVKIARVFVNLANEQEFIKSVAQDSRSFKRLLFTRAEEIIGRWGLESAEFIKNLAEFADIAEATRISEEEEELELGEIPDEFLDPLMFTLMEDPVTLPSSKVNIDRSTIRAHLLSDSTDPFNRMPLKLDDVIPNDDLKREILEFKAKSKSKNNVDATMTDV